MLNKYKRNWTRPFLAGMTGIFLAAAQVAPAAVSPEEAERLKGELMPLGGERAGNDDGTIPEWWVYRFWV